MNKYDMFKYLTVRIEAYDSDGGVSVGTGFFMQFSIDGKSIPVIVTVRHIIDDCEEISFVFHYKVSDTHVAAVAFSYSPQWIYFTDCELCCCLLEPMNNFFKKAIGYPIYYKCLQESNVVTEEELKKIDVLQEVVMLGYPGGSFSTPMNYPLFRKGWLASPPSDNFANGNGFVDITASSGSSGSPLLLCGANVKLIGILNKTVMENQQSSADLGMYIDAHHLLNLEDVFLQ